MAVRKPNMELDFTYYFCMTWYCACATQMSLNMELLGPSIFLERF